MTIGNWSMVTVGRRIDWKRGGNLLESSGDTKRFLIFIEVVSTFNHQTSNLCILLYVDYPQ